MVEIRDFLAARLDEDEATAKAVEDNSAPFNGQWYNDGGHALRTRNDWVLAYEHHGRKFRPGLLDHLARHDPARVLREVAAKRQIMEFAEKVDALAETVFQEFSNYPEADGAALLKLLALTYADHPDYNPEWSPA